MLFNGNFGGRLGFGGGGVFAASEASVPTTTDIIIAREGGGGSCARSRVNATISRLASFIPTVAAAAAALKVHPHRLKHLKQ